MDNRKNNLRKVRPGAVFQASEPRLIWVQMVKCPEFTSNKSIFTLCRKFNNIMETVIANDKHSHILKPLMEANSLNFNRDGTFTVIGKEAFWREVDSQMRDFDRYKTELTPTPVNAPSTNQHHSNAKYQNNHHG